MSVIHHRWKAEQADTADGTEEAAGEERCSSARLPTKPRGAASPKHPELPKNTQQKPPTDAVLLGQGGEKPHSPAGQELSRCSPRARGCSAPRSTPTAALHISWARRGCLAAPHHAAVLNIFLSSKQSRLGERERRSAEHKMNFGVARCS